MDTRTSFPPFQQPFFKGNQRSLSKMESRHPLVTMIAYGDSLSGGTAESIAAPSARTNASVASWAQAVLLQQPQILLRAAGNDSNYQVGGTGADWLYANILPSVIAAAPDVCIVHAGANNLATARQTHGTDYAAAIAEIAGYLELTVVDLRAAGIRPILCTITPDAFPLDASYPPATGYYHADFRTIRAGVNNWIRTNAARLGCVLCDWAGEISTDPDDDTAPANRDFLSPDNIIVGEEKTIHYNAAGYVKLGNFLAAVIDTKFRIPGRTVLPAAESARWISLNPAMTGSVSGMATSWAATATGGATVTRTKNADGSQRLVITGNGSPGDSSKFVTVNQNVIKTDRSTDNKIFRGYLRAIIAPGSEFYVMQARAVVAGTGVTTANAWGSLYAPSSGIDPLTIALPHEGEVIHRTPPLHVPPGTGADSRSSNFSFNIYGNGTIDIITAGILEDL